MSWRDKVYPGAVSGKWTVLDQQRKRQGYVCDVLCRCACGVERWMSPYVLIYGKTRSCPKCFIRRTPYPSTWRTRAAVGARFGRWTVLEGSRRTQIGNQARIKVLARCDCGEEFWNDVYHLIYGHSKACKECSAVRHFIEVEGKSIPLKRSAVVSPATMNVRIRRGIPPIIAALEKDSVCVTCLKTGHTSRACEYHELREKLRREHPGVSRERIRQLFQRALGLCQKCQEPGDAFGRGIYCAKHREIVNNQRQKTRRSK